MNPDILILFPVLSPRIARLQCLPTYLTHSLIPLSLSFTSKTYNVMTSHLVILNEQILQLNLANGKYSIWANRKGILELVSNGKKGNWLPSTTFIVRILDRLGDWTAYGTSTPIIPGPELIPSQNSAEDLKFPYLQMVGSFIYVMISTRPNLEYALSAPTCFFDFYKQDHFRAKRVLIYLVLTGFTALLKQIPLHPHRSLIWFRWRERRAGWCVDESEEGFIVEYCERLG